MLDVAWGMVLSSFLLVFVWGGVYLLSLGFRKLPADELVRTVTGLFFMGAVAIAVRFAV